MTDTTTSTETDRTDETERTSGSDRPGEHWNVRYDVQPIRIRDPAAEALAVLDPGTPFVVTYEDVVRLAGHSCPTASGAYRIAQLGLAALYPDDLPVRGDVAVAVPGPRDDATYGVMSRIVSYVTGAAREDGFGGLGDGHGDRRNLLSFDAFEADTALPTFRLTRTDTGERVQVTYHVDEVPDAGPAMGHLATLVDGSASEDERAAFAEAWHGRVRRVLADDDLFTVESLDPAS